MTQPLPLAVDLDGTLAHGDVFARALWRYCRERPWHVLVLAALILRGRPHVKAKLARRYPLDAAQLRYDERVLEWLRQERAKGRTIALATAADERDARAVAAHLGLFDYVFASDGQTNLKAARKAQRLAQAFPQGFVYAGNERADLKVWAVAARAVVVNATAPLEHEAQRRFDVERVFTRTGA
jgi:phosphoserine phosphatase